MRDYVLAAQTAIFAALKASAALQEAAPSFEYVPEDSEPPMTILSRFTMKPAGGKGDRFYEIEAEITSVVRKPGREHLTPIMMLVLDLIDGAALPDTDGVALSKPVFLSQDDELMEDGQTYLGTQRFTLFAQPAD